MSRPEAESRFEGCVAVHGRALLAYLMRRLDEPQDAADLMSEVYATAWRRISEAPSDPERALPWLSGRARGLLSNFRRAELRRDSLATRLGFALRQAVDPATAESVTHVRQLLDALPELDREVLCLLGWEELTHIEVAMVLGISPAAARKRAERARARLAAQLAYSPADSTGR